MSNLTKVELELKEQELKVKELDLKVMDLSTPFYRKFSFWTTIFTIAIAALGLYGQNYISNIRAAEASLKAAETNQELKDALAKKNSASKELSILENRRAVAKNQLDSTLKAFNQVLDQVAYAEKTASENMPIQTEKILTRASTEIRHILQTNVPSELLKSSKVTVYYVSSQQQKAIAISTLLKDHGVKSRHDLPSYSINEVVHNEIVYYNEPQLVYCRAVQKVLEDNGYGDFKIRLSSGANATYKNFKIYVVR